MKHENMLSEIHQILKTTFHREGNGEVTSRAWGKGIFQLRLLLKKNTVFFLRVMKILSNLVAVMEYTKTPEIFT